jgi:hypothetical protein
MVGVGLPKSTMPPDSNQDHISKPDACAGSGMSIVRWQAHLIIVYSASRRAIEQIQYRHLMGTYREHTCKKF